MCVRACGRGLARRLLRRYECVRSTTRTCVALQHAAVTHGKAVSTPLQVHTERDEEHMQFTAAVIHGKGIVTALQVHTKHKKGSERTASNRYRSSNANNRYTA